MLVLERDFSTAPVRGPCTVRLLLDRAWRLLSAGAAPACPSSIHVCTRASVAPAQGSAFHPASSAGWPVRWLRAAPCHSTRPRAALHVEGGTLAAACDSSPWEQRTRRQRPTRAQHREALWLRPVCGRSARRMRRARRGAGQRDGRCCARRCLQRERGHTCVWRNAAPTRIAWHRRKPFVDQSESTARTPSYSAAAVPPPRPHTAVLASCCVASQPFPFSTRSKRRSSTPEHSRSLSSSSQHVFGGVVFVVVVVAVRGDFLQDGGGVRHGRRLGQCRRVRSGARCHARDAGALRGEAALVFASRCGRQRLAQVRCAVFTSATPEALVCAGGSQMRSRAPNNTTSQAHEPQQAAQAHGGLRALARELALRRAARQGASTAPACQHRRCQRWPKAHRHSHLTHTRAGAQWPARAKWHGGRRRAWPRRRCPRHPAGTQHQARPAARGPHACIATQRRNAQGACRLRCGVRRASQDDQLLPTDGWVPLSHSCTQRDTLDADDRISGDGRRETEPQMEVRSLRPPVQRGAVLLATAAARGHTPAAASIRTPCCP